MKYAKNRTPALPHLIMLPMNIAQQRQYSRLLGLRQDTTI